MKLLRTLLAVVLIIFWAKTQAQVTAQDERTYKTVQIGSQIWMAENLDVSTYSNGDSILYMQDKGKNGLKSNVGWQTMNKGAWCYYENENGIDTTYGRLYNWFAVNDPRGLAPKGWHIPTLEEWKQLREALGGKDEAGLKLKSTTGWKKNGNGTNESGFNGFPAGLRYEERGIFGERGDVAVWWSSTKFTGMIAYYSVLSYRENKFGVDFFIKKVGRAGMSIRCIKD